MRSQPSRALGMLTALVQTIAYWYNMRNQPYNKQLFNSVPHAKFLRQCSWI